MRPGATSAVPDDQGAVSVRERRTKCLDRSAIDLADFLEVLEVMDETGMYHAVRSSGSTAQTVQIFEIAPVHLSTSGGE